MMRVLLVLLTVLLATSAQAQVYGDLSYVNIVKTILRFGAANLTKDEVIDDYIKLAHCDLFQQNFRDDFKLQAMRLRIRKKMSDMTAGFPDAYYFKSKMYLDRYDFAAKNFRLTDKSKMYNTNSFFLAALRDEDICVSGEKLEAMPMQVGATLDQPVTLEGLPIGEERAKALLATMNAQGNTQRAVYARFSLLITFAPPVDDVREGTRYNMDAQLLNIEFFEDPEFTKPIWVFTRS